MISARAAGPLAGLRFAVKDNIDVEGWPTGCGNPEWARRQGSAKRSATVVTMLCNAAATFCGKTITDEFAWSATGNNPHYGAPPNPLAPQRFTGGSSCGSASVVAQGHAEFALGTDTGGSVRIPAAFTGLFGMRPTYGSIPIDGVMPLAPSLDTVGFMAKSVQVLYACGSVLLPFSSTKKWVELCIAEDAFALLSTRHQVALEPSITALKECVSRVRTKPLVQITGGLEVLASAFQVFQAAEVRACLLPKLEGLEPYLGEGLRQRIAYANSVAEVDAVVAREKIARYRQHILQQVGEGTVVVLPTTRDVAPLRSLSEEELTTQRVKLIELGCVASITGMPQITLPVAMVDGVPFGLSIMGSPGSDRALLDLACELQQRL